MTNIIAQHKTLMSIMMGTQVNQSQMGPRREGHESMQERFGAQQEGGNKDQQHRRSIQQSREAADGQTLPDPPLVEHPCLHEGFSRVYKLLEPIRPGSPASVTLVGR